MLVDPQLATAIAWGIGGVLLAIGILGVVMMVRRERPVLAIPFAVVALLGLLVGISRQGHGTPVVIVRVAGGAPLRIDQRLYGTSAFQYADGHGENIDWSAGRTIVINDTPVPMVLETLNYGVGASTEADLPPFRSFDLGGPLEFFGPDDRPPTEITTPTYGETKYWLRW